MPAPEHGSPPNSNSNSAPPDPRLVPDWVHGLVPLERPLAVLDLEATGTTPHRDRIVELAVLKIWPDGHRQMKHRRLNPGMPIPPESTEVHGIRDEDVANEPDFRHIAASLAQFLEDCDLAGFGIVQFDLPMLRTEFERAGVEFRIEGRRIIDAKAIYHAKEPRNLAAAHVFYCGEPFEAAHSAEADALAAYRVLVRQLQRYEDLPRSMQDLHRLSNPRQADFVDSEGKLIWRSGEVHFNFGKHRGTPLREVCDQDTEYVRWLIAKDFRADLKTVLAAALEGRYPEQRSLRLGMAEAQLQVSLQGPPADDDADREPPVPGPGSVSRPRP
jgi:DNA polymerase-3 subunit epsilon